jgi:hypothetical protein
MTRPSPADLARSASPTTDDGGRVAACPVCRHPVPVVPASTVLRTAGPTLKRHDRPGSHRTCPGSRLVPNARWSGGAR